KTEITADKKENTTADEQQKEQPKENSDGKAEILYSHLSGKVVQLEDVEDAVFSAKILGDGIAVEPVEGKLYAPCDAKVETVFDTKHAVSLVSESGCEIVLHIGIDTVKLNGEFFESHISNGQKVKKGDLLISFDTDGIKKAGYKLTTPMIVCNTDNYSSIKAVADGSISAGEKILEIKK
ncbi:MAG: PTS glucose transporter subunit IIA, partial [Acutalibacteraceae bacterium]